jgi:hypothetical protein
MDLVNQFVPLKAFVDMSQLSFKVLGRMANRDPVDTSLEGRLLFAVPKSLFTASSRQVEQDALS